MAVPAVAASLLEPIWAEFTALLPERGEFHPDHPLGCHRRCIPDRVVFEHIVEALVHGSGYERIASSACSDATIRRRLEQCAAAVTREPGALLPGVGGVGEARPHHSDRPQRRTNEQANHWVPRSAGCHARPRGALLEGIGGQVGQLHPLRLAVNTSLQRGETG